MRSCRDCVSYLYFINRSLRLRKTREIWNFDNQIEFIIKTIMLTFPEHLMLPF